MILVWMLLVLLTSVPAGAQVVAKLPAGPNTPAWNQGIQPIGRDNYWNAVECGKKGGANPVCVFWDTDLCKNEDFTLSMFTPYKAVAYEVWRAATRKQDPLPTPSFQDAQRLRVTMGVTRAKTSKNAITTVAIKRFGKVVKPATQSLDDAGGGSFIFDFAAFVPTTDITIEMVGRTATRTCSVNHTVLALFR